MTKVFGIDISEFQKGINLKTAKKQGVKFVIVRAGYTGSSNGINKAVDNSFKNHYKNAKKNNIPIGAYWFSRATSYEKGKEEAKYMYKKCLKGRTFEYPIAIDVEDSVYQRKATKKQITEAIKGFCEYLEAKGYYVSIYTNSNWFKNKINLSQLKKYDKWVANWGKINPSTPEHGLWQFGGETNLLRSNKIAGIVVDQDYSYYDYPSIMINKKLNGYSLKSLDKIVHEVIEGLWGNGRDRYKRLTDAGYNYQEVQNKVNELLNSNKITYTVKSGDTLSSIAKKYNMSWKDLYNKNKDIIGDNPNKIYVGQVLTI